MIELPTERKKVKNFNPRLIVLFGTPKSGKSTIAASLDDNLIIDLENGYRALEVMSVDARSVEDLFEIRKAIFDKAKELKKFPYRFITIDNATRLEEMCLPYAASLYRKTAMGANFGYLKDQNNNIIRDQNGQRIIDPKADVRTLPNGAGYLYIRNAVKSCIDMFRNLCETLILIAHVKDRQIQRNGKEMSEMSVDLGGKLADIVCGEADAVGYIYRDGNKTFMSFEGGDSTIREARPLHLRGKCFKVAESDESNTVHVDLSEVFLETQN